MRGGTIEHKPPFHMLDEPADNTSKYCYLQILYAFSTQDLVHTEIAREIAAGYHGPTGTGLHFLQFEQYGTVTVDFTNIVQDMLEEIVNLPEIHDEEFARLMELTALMNYLDAVLSEAEDND